MLILTQEEANELIAMLKKCADKECGLPNQGHRIDLDVEGEKKGCKFVISVNRQAVRSDKVSFNARYRKGDVTLLRLDMGPTQVHQNPDELGGERITGPHLHIYTEPYGDKYAIPYSSNNNDIGRLFYEFLERFNVNPKPKIYCQNEI